MLRFEGDRDYPQAPLELWTKLTDARFLVTCIPGVEGVSQVTADTATCKLRPGFAFVRGTLEVQLRIKETVPGTSARLLIQSKGIGSFSDVEASVALAATDTGSRLHWTAEVKELGGLLKAVPPGLIQAAAQKVVADAWTAVDARLAGAARPG